MDDKERAEQTLTMLAKRRALQELSPAKDKLEKMAKTEMKDLGIPMESLAVLKALDMIRRGKVNLRSGPFEFEASRTPAETKVGIGFKKDF